MVVESDKIPRFSTVLGLLLRKMSKLNRDQKVCYGLTMPQCVTIESLATNKELTMTELRAEIGGTLSTTSRICDVLARNGVIERWDDENDRRQVRVRLTVHGKELAEKLRQCSVDYSRSLLELVPAKERESVILSLETMVQAIDSMEQTCCK